MLYDTVEHPSVIGSQRLTHAKDGVAVDDFILTSEARHLILIMGNIGRSVPGKVFCLNDGCIDSKLNTSVGDITHVAQLATETCSQFNRFVEQQVAGLLMIEIEDKTNAAAQDGEVQAEVVGCGRLPLQVVVAQGTAVVARVALSVAKVIMGGNIVGEETVVADFLIADCSDAGSQFQVFNPLHPLQPFLFVYVPREAERREPSPLVVLGEARRAVGAEGGGEVVAVEE